MNTLMNKLTIEWTNEKKNTPTLPNLVVECLRHLICIREVPDSKLGLDIVLSLQVIRGFTKSFQAYNGIVP